MHQSYQDLAARALACYDRLPDPDISSKQEKRLLVAIAGPPGSKKGGVASKVAQVINQTTSCSVVPIDGWCRNPQRHLDSLIPKSPAWTFRGAAAVDLVEQIRNQTNELKRITSPFSGLSGEDDENEGLKEACGASIVIFEGLYLLCGELPWARIQDLVDERWFVEVTPELAKERVAKRYLEAGVEPDYKSACERYDNNDSRNAEFVKDTSSTRDVTVNSVGRASSSSLAYE